MSHYIYLDDNFVSIKRAKVSPLEPGFLYGWGLFETMRSYNGKIFQLDAHLDRLFKSASLIDIKLNNKKELKNKTAKLLKLNSLKDACVRLTVWKGNNKTHTLIFMRKFPLYPYKESSYKNGESAIITKFRQNEFSILSKVKSLNYLNLRLAYMEAQKKGAFEGILLNTKGHLAEGSRTNIFLVKKNKLFTPSCNSGCLAGITRAVVIKLANRLGIKAYERQIKPNFVYKAEEAFLTNSVMEIMPLVKVDNDRIGKGNPGEITLILLSRYRELTIA